jgi:hypothetical protein
LKIPKSWMPHKAVIATPGKTSPTGQLFNDPITVRAYIEDQNKLVRSSDGSLVLSSAKVFLDPQVLAPVGSQVTVHPGTVHERTSIALTSQYLDRQGLMSHVVLNLE